MVRPSVPLATPTDPVVPMKAEASSSKPLTFGPRITRPLRSTDEHGVLDAVLQLGVLSLDVHESDGHVERLLAAGKVEPGTYHRAPRRGLPGGAGAVRPPGARYGTLSRMMQSIIDARRPVGDRPHRRLGPAGRLLPDAARERLHPGAERGDHALRRLRRERGHHDAPRHHRRRGGRQRRRLLDRLRGRPLRRPALHRQVRQVRPAPPPPRGAGGALVRQVRAASSLLQPLPADRAHVHLAAGRDRAGCPSGSSPSTPCSAASRGSSCSAGSASRLGANWEKIRPYLHYADYAVVAALVVIVVWAVLKWRKGRRSGGEPDVTEYGDEA